MNDALTHGMVAAHLVATLYMTGLIWFVQIVHYPLFDAVGRDEFANYERRHRDRTTWAVGPPMLVEAATAALLCWRPPIGPPVWQPLAGLVLLIVVWASTALLQIPCHERLAAGFDERTHRRLVVSNWLRTVAWSLRAWLAVSLHAGV